MSVDIAKLSVNGREILKKFVDDLNLRGAIIATAEGLEMTSYFKESEDTDSIAADTATILASIQNFLQTVEAGELKEIIINAENGHILIENLGDGISLAVVAPKNFTIGALLVALRKFVAQLQG